MVVVVVKSWMCLLFLYIWLVAGAHYITMRIYILNSVYVIELTRSQFSLRFVFPLSSHLINFGNGKSAVRRVRFVSKLVQVTEKRK